MIDINDYDWKLLYDGQVERRIFGGKLWLLRHSGFFSQPKQIF